MNKVLRAQNIKKIKEIASNAVLYFSVAVTLWFALSVIDVNINNLDKDGRTASWNVLTKALELME